MEITIYVVWTLEDQDHVDIFISEEEANAQYEAYGEFGCWEEKTFNFTV